MESKASTASTFTRGYWEKSRYISLGAHGHWTKWGGKRFDLVMERVTPIWYCQRPKCRRILTDELSPYRYEIFPGEFIRICFVCYGELQTR